MAAATRRAAVGGDDQFMFPYGVMSPAQRFAMKVTRFMHDHGIRQEALRAISLACYHHAQNNPNAVMRGRHARRGEIRRLALDHRAVLPSVRLLHGERRCRRGDRRARRTRARLPGISQPGCSPAAGLRPSQRGARAQHAELPQFAFPPDRASALRHGETEARRHGHRAMLREFHRRRADEPGGARPGAAPRKPTNSWSRKTCWRQAEKCR